MSDAGKLLRTLKRGSTHVGGDDGGTTKPPFAIATIASSYTGSGRPPLLFDGETVVGSRLYPYLSSYAPTKGDRVLVAQLTNSGVILGKIT